MEHLPEKKIHESTPSFGETLLVNSVALISMHKFSMSIWINSGDWSSRHFSTLVICMWNNSQRAEHMKNKKEWECPFTEMEECRSISAKPTGKIFYRKKHILGFLRKSLNWMSNEHWTLHLNTRFLSFEWSVNKRIIVLDWSRLGLNRYGTNTYLRSSYSRSKNLFRTCSADNSHKAKHVTAKSFQLRVLICSATTANHQKKSVVDYLQSDSCTATPDPFRKNLVEFINHFAEMKKTLGIFLVPALFFSQNLFSEIICVLPVLEHAKLNYLLHISFSP